MSLNDISRKVEQKRSDMSQRTSPVTNAIHGVNSGAGDAKNAVSGVVSSAGETFNQLGSLGKNFPGLKSSIGNLFGGSNDVADNPVQTSGSGEGGAAPGSRVGNFATNPSEALPSMDPVKRDVSKPYVATNAEAKGVMDYLNPAAAGDVLSSGWDSLSDIVSSVQNTVAPIQQRIEQSLDMVGSVAALPDKMMQQVSNIVNSAAQVENGVRSVIDGVEHTFNSFEALADYNAVNQFISDYSSVDRETDTMDVEAMRALILSMGQTMIVEGQQAKIEELIQRIPDEKVRLEIYDDLIVVGAELGYVSGVEYYQLKLGAGHGELVADKVVRALMANLTLEKGDNYKSLGQRMLTVFGKLKATWNMSAVANRVELFYYTLCNGNALTALVYTPHRPYAVAGGNVKSLTPTEMAGKFFPIQG